MEDPENKITVLCLGPKGSGKTTLLKKFQDAEGIDYTYNPVPTIGTNIYDVNFLNKNGKKQILSIREVGGEMASLWSNYFDGVEKVSICVCIFHLNIQKTLQGTTRPSMSNGNWKLVVFPTAFFFSFNLVLFDTKRLDLGI